MSNILNKISMLQNHHKRQRGAVLLIMLVILVTGATTMLLNALNNNTIKLERDKVTAAALAQAKMALIGYAASVDLTGSNRPGDLPCPDITNDGMTDSPCGDASGSNQALRLGRLPWKSLGLPDLRDGSGERLWYAVSNNFKKSTRTALLNSDTNGTISFRASDGSLLNDATNFSGVVALIIAPGDVLTRQGSTVPQDHSSAGANNPQNYLDIANGEDNADFIDGGSNGFIQGSIKDSNDKLILNDQILVITQNNFMQAIQKRVIGEVKNCLNNYALVSNGRFPWAVPVSDVASYFDQSNILFGRIPDNMSNSRTDSINTMSNQWVGGCKTHTIFTANTWWLQWREMVFYGLSDKFKPNSSTAPDFLTTCAIAGNCLNINSTTTPAKYVVISAGKKLTNPDQAPRDSIKTNFVYYLEDGNENATQTGAYTFTQKSVSATFNDTMVY